MFLDVTELILHLRGEIGTSLSGLSIFTFIYIQVYLAVDFVLPSA